MQEAGEQEFVVVYTEGASLDAAHDAVAAAGGTIVTENTDVGVATVVTTNADFAAAADAQDALDGNGPEPRHRRRPRPRRRHRRGQEVRSGRGRPRNGGAGHRRTGKRRRTPRHRTPSRSPTCSGTWQQIGATVDGSYRFEKGKSGVLVGILDTGVDGSHPDIAPNFHAQLSRNFTVDIPVDANGAEIDGPCAAEPDQSCEDPSNVDENGHGTHVASTIASPINGIGIAGVAPKATIVNLRAGQDSGYFFLQPSVDALTYAGNIGIDVVNMSYYVDPWLFNCTANPADSPEDQAEQRTIIEAMQRALDFAHRHGVTLVAAAGNGATDYTKVITDASSPDFADVARRGAVRRDHRSRRLHLDAVRGLASDLRERHRASRPASRTTPTTATATSTSRPPAATCTTRPTTPATSPRRSSPPTRSRWRRSTRRARPQRRPDTCRTS